MRNCFFRLVFAMSFCCPSVSALADFLPPNKLHLNPSPTENSNISQKEFNAIITKVEKTYAPIFAAHKAKLKINRLWKDETVNASASQDGNVWAVDMYGGLARRPEITPDAFYLVICHEIGHHVAGFSFVEDWNLAWASNEGQSDYFAVQACAREVWNDEAKNNEAHRQTVNPVAKLACDTNHSTQALRDICYRASDAGLSLATLFASATPGSVPKFETPTSDKVDRTRDSHPQAQCRLDTYLAGASCPIAFSRSVIPAKDMNNRFGPEAESIAGQSSCLAKDGWVSAQRPRCWFKPQLEFEGLLAQNAVWQDASGNKQTEPGELVDLTVPLQNGWNKTTQGVSAELFSRTVGIFVTNSKTSYRDIAPGEIVLPSTSFQIQVSKEFKCGHPFELLFRVNSQSGTREFPIVWHVGPKRSEDLILTNQTGKWEVPDAPSEGTKIPFWVYQGNAISNLEVEIHVSGLYPDENEFSLVLPNGATLPLDTNGKFDYDSTVVAKIELPFPLEVKGDWALKIKDKQENDTIKVDRFVVRAPLAEHVTCNP